MRVYKGEKPFLFLSYAHEDWVVVRDVFQSLYRCGYRFWYDEGIYSGADWAEMVEQRITDCEAMLVFLSSNAIESEFCRDEIVYALGQDKRLLLVRLDRAELRHGLGLRLGGKNRYPYEGDSDALVQRLSGDEALVACKATKAAKKGFHSHEFWTLPISRFGRYPSGMAEEVAEPMLKACGPTRPMYAYDEYPRRYSLNACENHPEYGDERYFTHVREVGSEQWLREVELLPGKRYEARIRYRCHGAPESNLSGRGIADGLRASISVPEVVYPQLHGTIRGALTAADAADLGEEGEIWSCAYLYADDKPVFLEYVLGSAKIHNRGRTDGAVLSTRLFDEGGTYLGVNKLDGRLPSGDAYAGHITFEFKTFSHEGDCTIERSASVNGGDWKTGQICVASGDTVTFRTSFRNTSDADLFNVTFLDRMDGGLAPVPGSTTIGNNSHRKTLGDDIASKGFNTGLCPSGAYSVIEYRAVIPVSSRSQEYSTRSYVYHSGGSRSSSLTICCEGR